MPGRSNDVRTYSRIIKPVQSTLYSDQGAQQCLRLLAKPVFFAVLSIECLAGLILVSASFNERLLHTIDSIQEYQGSNTAVIAAGNVGNLLREIHRNLAISFTLWTCQSVNSTCYKSFQRYIGHSDTFPRPSFVIAPWQGHLPKGIFEDVRRLDHLDPNVYWIFAVDKHTDLDLVLSDHTCQVVTVAEKDISMAADGYKSCSKRVTSSTLEWKSLLGNQESEGTYPRDGSITFAIHEKGTIPPLCANMGPMFFLSMVLVASQLGLPELVALFDAYYAVNTTGSMHCADRRTGEALLREKQIDIVLYSSLKEQSTSVSEYRYAFYSPASLCFYSRSRVPVPPSLFDFWVFFFCCFVCLAPFCCTIIFIFRAKGAMSPNERVPLSAVVMVFLSTLLGRSPQGLNIGASPTRLAVVAWSLATFFIGNYLQSSVTASRTVPMFSPEIRTKEQLLEHLNEGTKDPCTGRFMHEVRGGRETEPVYKPVARALLKCQTGCLDQNGYGCREKARRGTHVYFTLCTETERHVALQHGLVVGDNPLASWQIYSAVHTRYPFRYQHRRLTMAVLESGIWMHYATRFPVPSGDDDTVSFDMALREYIVVLYAGLMLSLVIFVVEILVWLCIMKNQDRMARR